MLLLLKIFFIIFSSVFCIVGLLLLVSPSKYPALYAGFVNEWVSRRETTERGKRLAIRVQGLVTLTIGAFFALFVWAVM
jgi:hypothetical protein